MIQESSIVSQVKVCVRSRVRDTWILLGADLQNTKSAVLGKGILWFL